MKRIKSFFKTSILGGLIVILPITICLYVFKWIFNSVTDIIQVPTNLIMANISLIEDRELLADTLVALIILIICFIVGVIVKTQFGKIFYRSAENYLLKVLPGYSMIKEIVIQFLGDKQSPFSSVALVQVFENDTLMTAFVTDSHEDDSYTVFIPTGPNPTSGNIYHLKEQYVHHIDVGVEDAMRSIISCGAGSTKLIDTYSANKKRRESKIQCL